MATFVIECILFKPLLHIAYMQFQHVFIPQIYLVEWYIFDVCRYKLIVPCPDVFKAT